MKKTLNVNNFIRFNYIFLFYKYTRRMKKILLYSPIYRDTAIKFVETLNSIEESEDIEVMLNSPGGNVFAGWSIIGPLADRKGKVTAKVYGDASSMSFYFLLFMNRVESLDVSTFTVHRADGDVKTEEDRIFLANINKNLREKMAAKIDENVFKEVTGKSFTDIFEGEKRIDVTLSAQEAVRIGLVNKIIFLGQKKLNALNEKFVAFFDYEDEQGSDSEEVEARGSEQQEKNTNNKSKKMTKEEFRSQNPEAYNQILAEGKVIGIAEEKDRVEAYLQFMDIDAVSVKTEIEAGNKMSNKFMAEMTKKSISAAKLENLATDSPEAVVIDEKEKIDTNKTLEQIKAEKESKDFMAEVEKAAGLKVEEVL